jgi:hypothetical protein
MMTADRAGSPRSIGAKRGAPATYRFESKNVVGRTSWGVSRMTKTCFRKGYAR